MRTPHLQFSNESNGLDKAVRPATPVDPSKAKQVRRRVSAVHQLFQHNPQVGAISLLRPHRSSSATMRNSGTDRVVSGVLFSMRSMEQLEY